ncbi:MAG TPA: hypothetical protein VGB74_04025, partial [Actinoplanes sp.]
ETAGTSFLDVRLAAVAAGATAYRKVLAVPAALACYAGRPGAELFPIAGRAHRLAVGTPWQHQPAAGTETGSNAEAWRDTWLHPQMGTTSGDGHAPQDYLAALRHVALTLDGDHQWRAWWRHSGLVTCELGIVAEGRRDHLRPSADIRRCDDRLKANFTCALPAAYDGRVEMFALAATEVRGMFEVIREAMTLPALPVTPSLHPLPPEADDLPVTTKPLPSVPREMEAQGYLTLAQIQEFFG